MEEINLIKRAQNGDRDAMSEIFKMYESTISYNTRKYFLIGADREDIIQEGMIGLLKAIRAYDDTKEASFKTFATLCIKRQVITAIKNSNSNKNKAFNEAAGNHFEMREGAIAQDRRSIKFHSPEEIILCKEKIGALREYLDASLSKMEREVFEYMAKGYTYIEISEKTGRKVKIIDNTMQRVKKKMRGFLDDYRQGSIIN